MSAPSHANDLHLLVADYALVEMRLGGTYMAVCGTLVPVSDLPPWECPEGCECDLPGYCPACVHEVAEVNGEVDGAGAAR